MKAFRCQLCDGKIHNGKCSLCGWTNQKIWEPVENLPAAEMRSKKTHPVSKSAPQIVRPGTSSSKSFSDGVFKSEATARKINNNKRPVFGIVVVVIAVIGLFIGMAGDYNFQDESDWVDVADVQETEYDWMDTAEIQEADISSVDVLDWDETGFWSASIEAGEYMVDYDIPAGTYDIQAEEGSVTVTLEDWDGVIYDTYAFSAYPVNIDETESAEGVKLSEDDMIYIEGEGTLNFTTENGQDVESIME